jgi:hypothetical protein
VRAFLLVLFPALLLGCAATTADVPAATTVRGAAIIVQAQSAP